MKLSILEYVGWERGLLLEQLEAIREDIRREYKKLPAAQKQPLKFLTVSLARVGLEEGFRVVRNFRPDVTLHAFGADLAFPNRADEIMMGSSEFLLEEDGENRLMLSGRGWLAPDVQIRISLPSEPRKSNSPSVGELLASCSEENSIAQLSARLRNSAARIGCIMIDDIPIGNSLAIRIARRILQSSIPIMVNVIPALATKEALQPWLNLKNAWPQLVGIGQHGYRHCDHSESGSAHEFGPSRSYAEQFSDIVSGRKILEPILDQPVRVFCPPFAFYDFNTLCALEKAGFTDLVGAENRLRWDGSPRQWIGTCNPVNSAMSGAWWRRLLLGRLVLAGRSDERGAIGIVLHPNCMTWECISWTLKVIRTLQQKRAVSWQIPCDGVPNHRQGSLEVRV